MNKGERKKLEDFKKSLPLDISSLDGIKKDKVHGYILDEVSERDLFFLELGQLQVINNMLGVEK